MTSDLLAALGALADEWEGWSKNRSTPRIDAFRDASEQLRALIAAHQPAEPERVTGVELHCDDCQQPYAVWFTDNEVWNFVMSGGVTTAPEWGGMLCPRCFTLRAEAVYELPIWRVRLDRVNRVAQDEHADVCHYDAVPHPHGVACHSACPTCGGRPAHQSERTARRESHDDLDGPVIA